MAPIDPPDAENSLEDCARQLDQFMRTASSFRVKADDKYTRSVECVVFMIANGRIPTIDEMTTDEYGLLSMSDIPVDFKSDNGSYKDLCHRVKRSIMYQCMELIFQMKKMQRICIRCS